MAPEYSGRGDPRRSLDLLWGDGPRPTRGPKPGLDGRDHRRAPPSSWPTQDGLDGLSMRRVAERLGVGTMSLYTYVPVEGRAARPDARHRRTASRSAAIRPATTGRTPTTRTPPLTVDWRDGLTARRAGRDWDLYHRHRGSSRWPTRGRVLGPNEMRVLRRDACASSTGWA